MTPNPTTTDPIQAQLIQARRTQILDAATQVFAEKGFHGATIRDVAKAAGIADGTIYNYFENKTGLLLGILNCLNESEQRVEHFTQTADVDQRTFMRAYIKRRLEVMTRNGLQVSQVLLSEILVNKELREMYYQQVIEPTIAIATPYYEKLVEQGRMKPLDIQLTIRAISGMFLGILMQRLIGDTELANRWDEIPDFMTDLILYGLDAGAKS